VGAHVFDLRVIYIVLITSPPLFTEFLTCVLSEVSASGLSLVQMSPSECDCEPSTEEAVADYGLLRLTRKKCVVEEKSSNPCTDMDRP
jgi:hypothetical protein